MFHSNFGIKAALNSFHLVSSKTGLIKLIQVLMCQYDAQFCASGFMEARGGIEPPIWVRPFYLQRLLHLSMQHPWCFILFGLVQ